MATATILPVAALVAVISRVTAEAGHGWTGSLCGHLVAALAAGPLMCPFQREIRQAIVIELDLRPRAGSMAFCAFSTVLAFMRVILCVAGDAGSTRFLYRAARSVASRAACCRMAANQWETSAVMVECHGAPC